MEAGPTLVNGKCSDAGEIKQPTLSFVDVVACRFVGGIGNSLIERQNTFTAYYREHGPKLQSFGETHGRHGHHISWQVNDTVKVGIACGNVQIGGSAGLRPSVDGPLVEFERQPGVAVDDVNPVMFLSKDFSVVKGVIIAL